MFKSLRKKVHSMVQSTKIIFYKASFNHLKEPGLIWKELRHLGLVEQKTSGGNLLISVEELNEFFTVCAGPDAGPGLPGVIYLGDEAYSDLKFYWKDVLPWDIHKALRKDKSAAVGCE